MRLAFLMGSIIHIGARRRGLMALSTACLIVSIGGCGSSSSEADSIISTYRDLPLPSDSVDSRGPYPYQSLDGHLVLAHFNSDGEVSADYQGILFRGQATGQGDFQAESSDPPLYMRCESDFQQTGRMGVCEVRE